MQEIPQKERLAISPPYLDSQSPEGVYAALGLTSIPTTRDRALEYLAQCQKSEEKSVEKSLARAMFHYEQMNDPNAARARGEALENILKQAARSIQGQGEQ